MVLLLSLVSVANPMCATLLALYPLAWLKRTYFAHINFRSLLVTLWWVLSLVKDTTLRIIAFVIIEAILVLQFPMSDTITGLYAINYLAVQLLVVMLLGCKALSLDLDLIDIAFKVKVKKTKKIQLPSVEEMWDVNNRIAAKQKHHTWAV